jgi:hypothetical protein
VSNRPLLASFVLVCLHVACKHQREPHVRLHERDQPSYSIRKEEVTCFPVPQQLYSDLGHIVVEVSDTPHPVGLFGGGIGRRIYRQGMWRTLN